MRLFQNFSFWNSFLRFNGKTGLLTGFPRACPKLTGFWNKLKYESEDRMTKKEICEAVPKLRLLEQLP
jgi:hypothetical protein